MKGHAAINCRRKPARINQAVVEDDSSDDNDEAEVYMMEASHPKNSNAGLWQAAAALKRK